MYIYRINILMNEDENPAHEAALDSAIAKALQNLGGEHVSSDIIEIQGNNFGKCRKCGIWCSDRHAEDHVADFSAGVVIDGEWICDTCLPADHPCAF